MGPRRGSPGAGEGVEQPGRYARREVLAFVVAGQDGEYLEDHDEDGEDEQRPRPASVVHVSSRWRVRCTAARMRGAR